MVAVLALVLESEMPLRMERQQAWPAAPRRVLPNQTRARLAQLSIASMENGAHPPRVKLGIEFRMVGL